MSIQLTGYHIGHTALANSPIIFKYAKDGHTIGYKQIIDNSEALAFIIERLRIENNELEITANGKLKYRITLTEISE
jgi:hypothetical protein